MKSIPIALQGHFDGDALTTCMLLRIYTKDGTLYGFTTLNAPLTYNPATVDPHDTGDAWGSAVHRADNGFSPSRFQATADLSVDNMEAQGWVTDTGITEQMIRSGLFDHAQWRLYRVNYMDLTQGHELVNGGTCGETVFSNGGWKVEFRSLIQQLRQPLAQLYSITCRKRFGSKAIGTGGEQPEERHPCTVDWSWASGTVTSVSGVEPNRIFTDTSVTEGADYYNPGVIEWLTGNNAGAQSEIESNTATTFTLSLELTYPIQPTDTYRRRQDCNKVGRLGDCKLKHNNYPNFGGEEDIPVADGGTLMVPGAHIRQ